MPNPSKSGHLADRRVTRRLICMLLASLAPAYCRVELAQVAILTRTLHPTWPCGDANNNGRYEIYGAGDDDSLTLYECESSGVFREHRPGVFVGGTYDIGDVDNDGLTELLVARRYCVILKNPERNAFPTDSVWGADQQVAFARAGFADLDRDGRGDIVFCSNNSDGIRVWESRGANQFGQVFFPYSRASGEFAIGDFDQNGRTDLVAGGGRSTVYVFTCLGDDQYITASLIDVAPDFESYDLASATDMDGNGLDEFVVLSRHRPDSCAIRVFEASAQNQYECVWQIVCPGGDIFSREVATGDADGDGRDEFAVSTGQDIRLFKSSGPEQYEQNWQYGRPYIREMRFFDLNGNGRDELIISPCSTYIFEDTTGLLSAPYEKQSRRTPAVARPTVARIGMPVRLDALPMKSEVEVVNAEGRTVLRHRVSGSTSWRWDQRDEQGLPVPVGTYYCVIRARNQSTSLKLCVVK